MFPLLFKNLILILLFHDFGRMAGFDEFYKSVDYVTQRALTMCSDVDLAGIIDNGRQGSG